MERAGVDTELIGRAFALAMEVHGAQIRKGSGVPYLSHVMAVAALVWEAGGSDEQAAAALLHDYVEDGGGTAALERLRAELADHPVVVEIVEGCSDSAPAPGEEKPPWEARKTAYLASLATKPPHVLLVTAADKLHNARSIVADHRQHGEAVWDRFSRGAPYQLWYYRQLADRLGRALPGPLTTALGQTVDELVAFAREARPGIDAEVAAVADELGG